MAFECIGSTIPGVEASADLSADQFKLVIIDSNGQAALAGAGVAVDGVLQNKPSAQGQAATVWGVGSVSKVVAGAAVAAGAAVTPDASGLAVTAASGDYILGRALEAATASGDLIAVWINQPGRVA